jgi:hypothetical protein
MRAAFQIFKASFRSWEALLLDAADFASRVGPERVISISHSEDKDTGVVVVWYWADVSAEDQPTGGFPVVTDR